MKSVLFISDSRESLPIAWRIQQEGVKVYYYIHDKTYRSNFQGIMENIGLEGLSLALRKADTVIFDITLPTHKPLKPHDVTFLKKFGVNLNVPGVFGHVADKLMKDHLVIGSSSFTEHLELDREAGFKIAEKIGFSVPEYQKFKGLKEGIRFLQSSAGKKNRWVFKMLNNGPLDLTYPDTFDGEILDMMLTSLPQRLVKEKFDPEKIEYILQSFVEGEECSNELWTDGDDFINPNRTIESKKLGSGETGVATGSQMNVVAMCSDMGGPAFKELQRLKPYIRRSGYVGPLDANVIFAEDGKLWWLEATFRFGWSALYCLCRFIPKGQLANFFLNGFTALFDEGYVASQLMSLYPYPDLDKKKLGMMVEGNLVNHRLNDPDLYWQDIYADKDKLRCCGSDGIIGVIACLADTPEEAINKAQVKCKKFEVTGNKQWRDDHLARHMKRINKLRSWGIEF